MEYKRVFNTETGKWEDIRVYTEEDLRKAFKAGKSYGEDLSYLPSALDEDEYIDSLNK